MKTKKPSDALLLMSSEEFDAAFRKASSYSVWVQISPLIQGELEITADQARCLANIGFGISHDKHHYSPDGNGSKIWARLDPYDNALTFSLTSQSIDRYYGKLPFL